MTKAEEQDLTECEVEFAHEALEVMRLRKLLGERLGRYHDHDTGVTYYMDMVDYLPWTSPDEAIDESLRRM